MPKNTQTTQKQKLKEWRSQAINPNGIVSQNIKQHLTLGREPDAQAQLTVVNGKQDIPRWDSTTNMGDWGSPAAPDFSKIHQDSKKTFVIRADGENTDGNVAIVTYTNLRNSYYIDSNGIKHNIAKIVRTFSDLTSQNTQLKDFVRQNVPNDKLKNTFNSLNPSLIIYSDPTDGFWYNWASGITVTDKYYDEDGNQIDLNNNAYIAVTSLNNETYNHGFKKAMTHKEAVTVNGSSKGLTLAGSAISNHNNTFYADNDTQNFDDGNWDRRDSNEQYYGSTLILVNGNQLSLRYSVIGGNSDWNPDVWVTTTTIIPQTPNPSTTINYHYDTSPIFFILSLWWLSMQAYIIAIAFTSYAVVLSIHA